ncbi:uridine diphosphate glucose pyrophosphatase NUDT14 isoform X3 [Calonectris borealis]|uniref:uridine diphosphate glucose pyrophosphatase NUDT14 isoform X3 n=1 Tax=Calonectris borealis TaxID=1323832 RepID=UPI003F4C3B34
MEAIEELALKPCTSSLYLRPFRLCYRQNGTGKFWDFMRTHDSVSILIFNTSRQCFVVVKQFRPAVYMCEVERHHPQVFQHQDKENFSRVEDPLPAVVGVTYELCAGIVDKPDLSLEEIACGEVLEECGYRVPVTDLRRITSYRMIKPAWWAQCATPAAVKDRVCVVLSAGRIFSCGEVWSWCDRL